MVQDIQRILDLKRGRYFYQPPLLKTIFLSKYTTLTSWIRTRIMHSPWLNLMHDVRYLFYFKMLLVYAGAIVPHMGIRLPDAITLFNLY
jgi:hypothetical protein